MVSEIKKSCKNDKFSQLFLFYSIVILTSPFDITESVRVLVSSFHSVFIVAPFLPAAVTVGSASKPEISITDSLKFLESLRLPPSA